MRSSIAHPCPVCESLNDAATPAFKEEIQAKAGDITICFNCTSWLIFIDDDLAVRRATPDEIRTIVTVPQNLELQQAIRVIHRWRQ